jgi:ABC-type molybdate transport system substrate-binding protein
MSMAMGVDYCKFIQMGRFLPAILVFFLLLHACRQKGDTLNIIHAGSLAVPVREAADSFERRNPGTRVLTEAWGSKAGARRVAEMDVSMRCFYFGRLQGN